MLTQDIISYIVIIIKKIMFSRVSFRVKDKKLKALINNIFCGHENINKYQTFSTFSAENASKLRPTSGCNLYNDATLSMFKHNTRRLE